MAETPEQESQGARLGVARRFSFGSAVLDERSFRLFVNSKPVELERKPLEVLLHLLRHAGELVTKDELLAAVWPGRILTETVLTKCVQKLREVLDDDDQRLIATVHGQGYRLDAEVRSLAANASLPSEAADASSQPSRRLAAIMFTDLVGYSALAHKDEALAIELLELHRGWVRELLPKHGGKEIETVGDAFLIEFSGALAAVECAVAIQQCFTDYNASAPENRRMQLRIGIHLGDVEHKGDKVMGDGVNIASRIHGMAEPGGICVSEAVYQVVRNRTGLRFVSMGRPALKHIATSLELYRVLPPGADAAPETRIPQRKTVTERLRQIPRPALAAAAVVAVVTGILLAIGSLSRPSPGASPSVAVLPFSNLSENPAASDYFAGGVHESILTHLARVKDLKVISRTSVMEYKDKTRNLREIGQALGVTNIVEGSVQRVGNRVRITAQLIEAVSDQHLWAETYDRDVADVFAIQSEVAERIVAAVKATLTPEEKERIEQRPTANPEAYDLYLRAEEHERQPEYNRETIFRIQTLLEQAIALDPGFALAHAALGRNHIDLYWYGIDTTTRRRDQARAAAETALRLQPDLAEGHLALGRYFYYGFRDYEQALKEFGEALSRTPNFAEVHLWVGAVQRRRGMWENSIATMNRVAELDPRNADAVIGPGYAYLMLRQYAIAVSFYEKAITLAPENVRARIWLAFFQLLWKGDLEPIRKTLAEIPPGVDPGQIVSQFRITLAQYEGRYAEAISLLSSFPRDKLALRLSSLEAPKDFYLGQAYTVLGDAAKARPHFLRAREQLRAYMTQEPESIDLADAHAWLGLTQAYLGERAEALRNADRALELLPTARDAIAGPQIALIAAATHMRLGDHGRALTELEQLLKTPAGPHAHELRLDPEWKPLWNDPRFQKLIAEHLPKDG